MHGTLGKSTSCGSGKKYKKCCLEKEQSFLEYQGYINKSLEEYPKENKNKNEVNLYDYYKEEYINIDKLLYKALKHKQIPLFVKRNKNKEDDIDFGYLDEAYNLIKEIIKKNKFKTIAEYDNVVSIHYSLYDFFQKYSQIFINKIKSMKDNPRNLYVNGLRELLEFFYDSFDLNNENEDLFLNRYHILFNETDNLLEGIKLLEDKLLNCKCDKYYVYELLFEEYIEYYDFDEAEKKINDLIKKEKNLDLKEDLKDLKVEMIECY